MNQSWTPVLALSDKDEPLYESIIRALSEDISSGKLTVDTRLPTHRELADLLKVALGTVTRAYIEAERRGFIRSEGRRGTFVGATKQSRTALATLYDHGVPMIDLSRINPPHSVDPSLAAALKNIARRADVQLLMQYTPTPGLMRHREAGARWLTQYGLPVDAGSVVITAGAQHALYTIFSAMTEPGDVIACEEYVYPGLLGIAERLRLQLVGVPADADGMLPDALSSVVRRRKARLLYCNPTLHNPTNTIYSAERRKSLVEVAEKHNLGILEDEIFRPLVPDPPPLMSTMAPERTCFVMSVSKTISSGLRVGFIVPPSAWKQKILDAMRSNILNVPALPAEIIAGWILDGTADKVVMRRRQELACRQMLLGEILGGCRILSHPNSCHAWVHLPHGWTSTDFSLQAQQRGVSIAQGELFAVDRRRSSNTLRLAVGAADSRESLKAGLVILASILERSGRPHELTV